MQVKIKTLDSDVIIASAKMLIENSPTDKVPVLAAFMVDLMYEAIKAQEEKDFPSA